MTSAASAREYTNIDAILLDDSEFDRARLKRTLYSIHSRFCFHEVTRIAHFFEAIRSYSFDIAFLDFDLPDGTSLDVLHALEQAGSSSCRLPCVIVTANESKDLQAEIMSLGACGHILKDMLGYDDLKPLVEKALQAPALRT